MATSAKVVFPVVFLAVCCVAISPIREMLDQGDLQMVEGVQVCGGRCNSTSFCQCQKHLEFCRKGRCVPVPLGLDFIFRNIPCPSVYKSFCVTDTDCPCKTKRLVCEENECVKSKIA